MMNADMEVPDLKSDDPRAILDWWFHESLENYRRMKNGGEKSGPRQRILNGMLDSYVRASKELADDARIQEQIDELRRLIEENRGLRRA